MDDAVTDEVGENVCDDNKELDKLFEATGETDNDSDTVNEEVIVLLTLSDGD